MFSVPILFHDSYKYISIFCQFISILRMGLTQIEIRVSSTDKNVNFTLLDDIGL